MATVPARLPESKRPTPLEQFVERSRVLGLKPPKVVRSDGRNDGYGYGDKQFNAGCDWRNW